MTALALLTKDGTLALANKIECQAQLDIPTVARVVLVGGALTLDDCWNIQLCLAFYFIY